jgi:hypothetical protein
MIIRNAVFRIDAEKFYPHNISITMNISKTFSTELYRTVLEGSGFVTSLQLVKMTANDNKTQATLVNSPYDGKFPGLRPIV